MIVDETLNVQGSLATDDSLPRWDLTVVFSDVDSPEFAAGFAEAVAAIDDLERCFDTAGVDWAGADAVGEVDPAVVDGVLDQYNRTIVTFETLRAYLGALVAADSRDDRAQARLSELRGEAVRLAMLGTRFIAWIGGLDVEPLAARSATVAAHLYPLRQAKLVATHLMSPAEEDLAAELNVSAGIAWAKLHDTLTSQLTVTSRGRRDGALAADERGAQPGLVADRRPAPPRLRGRAGRLGAGGGCRWRRR